MSRSVTVRLPDSLYYYVNSDATQTGKSRTKVVAEILRAHYDGPEDEDGNQGVTRAEFDALRTAVETLWRAAKDGGAI